MFQILFPPDISISFLRMMHFFAYLEPGLFPYLPTFPDEDEDAEKALAGAEEVLPEEDETAQQESKGLPSSVGGLLTRAEEVRSQKLRYNSVAIDIFYRAAMQEALDH